MTEPARAPTDRRRFQSPFTVVCAVALLLLGTLPIANWIPAGLRDPGYARRWIEWGYGSVVCAGAALVCAVLFGRANWTRAEQLIDRCSQMLRRAPRATDLVVAGACLLVYLWIALSVFDGRPLLIDEIIQVLQARMYATGHLSLPVNAHREFFSILHVVDIGDRVYSQFPPGWAVMLVAGSTIGAEWVVGPLCGAVSVFAFARLLRRVLGVDATLSVLGGSLLFGLAPFAAFQFGSQMSHGPALMWLLLSVLALSHALDAGPGRRAWSYAVAAGVCAGNAFAVRPLDATAFIIPTAIWLLWRARQSLANREVALAAAAGAVVPALLVAWVNLRTTGKPLLFGYEALWGASHGLGFHPAPWGDAHTPQRAIELISLYVTRLNTYLFESPFPSLLPVIVALLIGGPTTLVERLLFAGTCVHALAYTAYWHDGFYLGPRFVVPWLPALIILCVRLMRAARALSARARAAVLGGLAAALTLTIAISLPARIAQYRAGLASMRTDYGAEARSAGVTNSLVFVRESWGAQLVARMWALGVSRSATATLYSRVDACALEHAITETETTRRSGIDAEGALRTLLRDSALTLPSNVSPDTTERMLPGAVYDARCSIHVAEDREGYALLPPFLLDRSSGNVYVRDFGERDSLIMAERPGLPAFRLRRDGVDAGARLVWEPIHGR